MENMSQRRVVTAQQVYGMPLQVKKFLFWTMTVRYLLLFSVLMEEISQRRVVATKHVYGIYSTGKQITVLKHDGLVNDVVFSPDGKYMATASADNKARLWIYGNIEDLISEASCRLTRNLTPEEWKKYMGDKPYHKTFSNLS